MAYLSCMCTQGKGMRFVKNVGLGFKTPKTAREGNYVDKKCPFTGDVSIRGRILKVRAVGWLWWRVVWRGVRGKEV